MTRLFSTDSMIEQMRRENTHDEEQRLVIIGNGVDGNPYADDNRIWVRDIGSIGEGDYSIGGTAYRVLAGTGYLIEIDHHIWIQWQPGPNMWQGVMSDPDFMRVTGRSMHLLNSNDPHNAFRTTEGLLPLLSKPLPNGKANVQGWQATTEDNLYLDYKGTSDVPTAISQHQNVLSFAPTTAAHHRYVLLVFNITKFFAGTEDPIEMFASTSQSWFTPLDATDIQQCLDQMDANSRPIKAYRVYFGQDNLKGHADDRDLRGWLNVPSSDTTIEITSPDGTIDIAEPVTGEFEIDVADNAITQAKMADNSVGTAELINLNVTTAKLADDAVTIDKLANASVDSIHIIDGAVGTAELATNAVTQAKMADGSVGTAEIIDSSVNLDKLANNVYHGDVVDPTVNDDVTLGYAPGSRWINYLTFEIFECVDATDGAAIWLLIASPNSRVTTNFQRFVTPGADSWTKPAGAFKVRVICIAGGSGGGSGRKGASGTLRYGGAGGAAGNVTEMEYAAGQLGATEDVLVGAGGTGGTGISTTDVSGNNGATGDPSLFGGLTEATAKQSAINTSQGGGRGGTATTSTPGVGNLVWGQTVQFPGASGGESNASLATAQGKSAGYGPASGGAGGFLTGGNAVGGNGDGGTAQGARWRTTANGGGGAIGSSSAGGNGADGSSTLDDILFGDGGGGGRQANGTTTGAAGGNGGTPGGGGGGGSAAVNGVGLVSGAGGNGGSGGVIVITYCYA